MKKPIRKLPIFIFVILIVLVLFYVAGSDKSVTPSYFVWADKTINVYDVRSKNTKTYDIDGYNCRNIDKYYGGDFCCVGEKDKKSYALLFKEGKIEKSVELPFDPIQIVVYHNDIIASYDGKIYRIDNESSECQFLSDIAYGSFYVNENGDIAYCKDNGKEEEEEEERPVSSLYVYSNNNENYICETSEILYWQSNEEIIVRTFAGVHKNLYKYDDCIVNINSKSTKKTNVFGRVSTIKSWKQGSTAITTSVSNDLPGTRYMGIVCVGSKFFNSRDYYSDDIVKAIDVEDALEWFEENPMEKL